ncbi:hypothetical protein J40TS1_00860 [Paenibacillus montaniterrae]|uniref:Membrane protein NfeD2 N-terminal transmembrane domain-containing protein n=1 Tax=Paenibacillus montaniterrae TaxID=429341 RepID=A0A919YLW2_9BACL|nr:protease [Paenibacillus montaniterrae]GIP14444.1 hypothetical protein J40TS1_00860 [Paenibacillus montaniterrae]
METLFWVCFLIGVLYTLIVIIFGDALSGAVDASTEWLQVSHLPILQPTTLIGGLTIFGGAGILMSRFTSLAMLAIAAIALAAAAIGVVFIYYFYVKPMSNAEMSLSYSIVELIGKQAQVTVPIPAEGYGEVIVKTAGGIVNHTAASFDQIAIGSEATVVVIDLDDGVLLVSEVDLE